MKTTRRNFLRVSALAGGGFMMAIPIAKSGALTSLNPEEAVQFDLNDFLTIDTEGNITFILTKHEMGQGSGTGLPMILADELGADWAKVMIKRSDYDPKYTNQEMGTTGGSSTILKMWEVLRNAGATAREMFKMAASEKWGTSTENISVENSFVINKVNGERLEFGELTKLAAAQQVPKEVKLKTHEEFTIIGQPIKNLITDGVATGTANYGINIDIPGMVYAAIARCPVYKGKLASYDDTETRKVSGVIDVVHIPALEPVIQGHHVQEGVAVIASSTWAAFKGKKALKVEWDEGELKNASIDTLTESMRAVPRSEMNKGYFKGDLETLKKDDEVEWVEAEFDNPYQAHALMEPINATAHYRGDTCEVWVGTQSGYRVIQEVAKITGLPQDKITIHVLNSGGSFGRRFYADSSMEASYISMQLKKPVKLTWTREDEISHDYFHPYQKSFHKAAIKDNEVVGWETSVVRTNGWMSGVNIWDSYYDFPNIGSYSKVVDGIVHQGAWRSVAEHSSCLGRESFIDELATKTGKSALDFRLDLIKNDLPQEGDEGLHTYRMLVRSRFREVLNYIKDNNLYAKKEGKGIGLAIDTFSRTVCAHVVEVSDDVDAGYKVDKVTSVVHCGTLVNPHFGLGQIEGSIIWALSAVKYGGIQVENGRPKNNNFHNNRLLRIDEVPEMDVRFLESTEAPSGLGEPATPPLAPAVLNAIYDLTGQRLRKIPVQKEELGATVS